MNARDAVDFALGAGRKVRGEDASRTVEVSLALRASRTPDGAPILARAPDLAKQAVPALIEERRPDLALHVLLWLEDAGAAPSQDLPSGLTKALDAYRKAKAWAQGAVGTENLAWIRDVPRDFALREAVAQRLLLRAQADPARREGYASACLETELAELPRAAAFPTIFNGALVALSPATLDRTLAGLGVLDASEDSEESKRLFARLRAALLIERLEAEGRSLDEAARVVIDLAAPDQAAAVGPLALHLAAAYLRAGDAAGARRLFEATRKVVAAQRESGRELLVGLDFLERAAQGKPTAVTGADRAALLQTAPEALAAGAVEASRALRRPAPSVEALRLLDPEDVGMVIPWRERAALVRDLFKTGAWAAAEARDLGALKSLAELLRRTGLAGGWEIFLRALLADEAARLAAGSQSDEAWGLAVTLARRGPGAFEKAKMSGRIAFEFLRAAQLPPLPLRWVDPHFPSTRPAEAR